VKRDAHGRAQSSSRSCMKLVAGGSRKADEMQQKHGRLLKMVEKALVAYKDMDNVNGA
jgi:hypothetical protein